MGPGAARSGPTVLRPLLPSPSRVMVLPPRPPPPGPVSITGLDSFNEHLSTTERLVRLCDRLKSDRQQPIAKIRSQANANDSAVRKREALVGIARTDRRVRRTRDLLRRAPRALLSLGQEQGYERITGQDILDRADVGRSTFYAHYRDKDDLLLSGFEDIRAALATERAEAEHGAGAKREPP